MTAKKRSEGYNREQVHQRCQQLPPRANPGPINAYQQRAEESCTNLNESVDVTKVSKFGLGTFMAWLLPHLPRTHGCIWKWLRLDGMEVLSLPGAAPKS